MKGKRIGRIVFWVGAVYLLAMGFVVSFSAKAAYRDLSFEQVNRTPWAHGGPLLGLWASAVPIGAILAGVGAMLSVCAKRSRIWLFGLGVFAVLLADILVKWRVLPTLGHFPPLFGVAGALISLSFLAILWLWARKRATLEGPAQTAADLQLTGYVFLMVAMWTLCGDLSRPYQKALSELPPSSPVFTVVYLVLGWLSLLASHYASARATRE
ncbi:MAG: hypothetical protein ISS56_20155 [Anaerolineae bacterium]|nr:hypothetical protein [Anaerolineae bacterium]